MNKINQFFKFNPILKEKIWGGEKLIKLLDKKSNKKNIGESWELSDVENETSIVSNGNLKGKNLRELISKFKSELVGVKLLQKFGEKFPLLIKFIDAKETLSIQLHPSDDLLKGNTSFGKTEMWYVTQADESSEIIIGFKKDVSQIEYLHHLENKTLLDILNVDKVKKGDAYFVPPGRIHAIGAGTLIAEIQQTSDITYRIYDWDRKDANGNYRELHTEKALKAIDYSAQENYKTKYLAQENIATEIVSCPYFTTNILYLESSQIQLNHKEKDSFVIYMCVEGFCEISTENITEKLKVGETLLVPACIKELKISSEEKTELLEIYI